MDVTTDICNIFPILLTDFYTNRLLQLFILLLFLPNSLVSVYTNMHAFN